MLARLPRALWELAKLLLELIHFIATELYQLLSSYHAQRAYRWLRSTTKTVLRTCIKHTYHSVRIMSWPTTKREQAVSTVLRALAFCAWKKYQNDGRIPAGAITAMQGMITLFLESILRLIFYSIEHAGQFIWYRAPTLQQLRAWGRNIFRVSTYGSHGRPSHPPTQTFHVAGLQLGLAPPYSPRLLGLRRR